MLKNLLTGAKAAFIAMMPYSLIAVGVIVFGILIAIATYQSDSKNEKAAEDARTNVVLEDAQSNVQANAVERSEAQVEQTEKASQNARKQREKAKQTNTSNTDYTEANRQRCLTFPESPDCK